MNNICMGGVGMVYDEHDIPIGKILVDSTCGMPAAQYFFLCAHGNDDCWASAWYSKCQKGIYRLDEVKL